MDKTCGCGMKFKDEAYALLRVVTGFAFFYHGWGKIFGEMGVEGFVNMMLVDSVPFPTLVGYLVAYGELLGGLALILGFLTHWASKLYIVIMLGAIVLVHFQNGYNVMSGGYEYQLLLLVLGLFFMTNGAGKYSIEGKCADKHESAE